MLDWFHFKRYALISLVLVLGCLFAVHPVHAKQILDIDITLAIEDELLGDEAVDANLVDIETQQGVVTFTGNVDHLLAKERVEKIAENVVGVRAVINRLDVKPRLNVTDTELQKAIENALLLDPATDAYEVTASVNKGVVILTGNVDSWQERHLCEIVTKKVPGVVDVKNNVTAIRRSDRPDMEIKAEIEAMLKNDVRVDDNLILVKVDDSVVSLSGVVGSLAEKNRATTDAYVAGVRLVNADDLKIEWWARDTMRRMTAYNVRTDEQIKKAVKDAFRYDPRVFSFNPQVTVDNGKVILKGLVDNLRAKRAAEQDARNVIGVWRVKNFLKVRPDDIPTDDALEARIFKAFRYNPWLDPFDIDINALTGWVYLSGQVNSSFARQEAERVAESVKGVTRVINYITYTDAWSWQADLEIRENVKSELFWSPFVDEDQVNVSVFDGVVTLNGNVETWSERQAAEDNAYEGGAKKVINNLSVTHRFYGPYDSSFFNTPFTR
jgi:osmotically-inducible protein OsmY